MKFLTIIIFIGLFVFSAFSQSTKPKPTSPKPRPATTPQKMPGEKAVWDKATAISDATERIAALRKFVAAFPESAKKADALSLIVTTEAGLGDEKLKAGDVTAAAELYRTAAKDTPKPVPDQLFKDTLTKIPPTLYFGGARDDALEIAKLLEDKTDASSEQLLSIATFYMTIENGGEARRVANAAIALQPSSRAYQMLGLASRIDFQLDESATAYAKALEIEPDSLSARRGLAEAKRSLGKSDEAAALYSEILARDENNLPARTGLILSLFDGGKLTEAEAAMAKTLETSPNNVILLGGAAYWYAAHNEGDKAVEYGQRAVAVEPRFIWSHIALARGYLLQKDAINAERTLLAARRYGNFPSLDYEIASAQVAAGFFREASETLSKSFVLRDGTIHTNLGGRIDKGSANLTELASLERRASIFAPTAADDPESAARMRSLLELTQELGSATPNAEVVTTSVDGFVRGDDKLKIHRQLYAASLLLDKKIALPKVLELAKAASGNTDAGLDFPAAASAVMANELYKNRAIAVSRGEYIRVPEVPRSTLSAILRGKIEEITGWALAQTDSPAESVIHLKRAVSVMPADSVYWRSSMWRLGSALALAGKDAEALDTYIKCYRPGDQDAAKYAVIESLYKKVKGGTDGLEAKIGPNPALPPPTEMAVQKPVPSPTPEPLPEIKPVPTPLPTIPPLVPIKEEPKPQPTPEVKAETTPTPNVVVKTEPTPTVTPEPTKTVEVQQPLPTPTPTPQATPEVQKTPDNKPKETVADSKPASTAKELFPPVVITIPPPPDTAKPTPTENEVKPQPTPPPSETKVVEDLKPSPTPAETKTVDEAKPTPSPTPERKPDETTTANNERPRVVEKKQDEIKPCTITTSDETISLQNAGGNLVIIVGVEGKADLNGLTAVANSPRDIAIQPELDVSVKGRVLFLVRSISTNQGLYQIIFELPCGKKEIPVKVR